MINYYICYENKNKMSINYPLLNKKLQKKTSQKNTNTIASSYHPKKINLDEIYEDLLFLNKNKHRKKFSGKTIMNEAIKIGEKFINQTKENEKNNKKNIKYFDEIIEDTHFTARNNYVEKLSENFKINLRKNFKEILINSTIDDVENLEKKLVQIDEVKEKYEKALIENSKLQQNLFNLNSELRTISQNLHKKTLLINKEQLKNVTIKTIQPIFEELIKEFPEEDPKDIVTDLKINKEKYLSQIRELNKCNFKIDTLEKERIYDDNKNKTFQDDIKEKIFQQKLLTNSTENQLDKEYNVYKDEYEILLKYKKENEYLRQLLFNIYAWIKDTIPKKEYEIYIKKIGKDPLSSVKTFDAKIFNSKNFISLVNENILMKATNCYDGVLLRSTIAFGNYLARKHLKQYNKYRYDPVGTFREIKSVIDAKEFENYQLIGVIKDLNHKKMTSLLKIKELTHQLKKGKMKFHILENKFQKFIKLSHTKNEDEKLNKMISNTNTSFSIRSPKTKGKSVNKNINKIKNSEEDNKINKFRKKFFITNDGQKGKNKNIYNNNKKPSVSSLKHATTEINKINNSFYEQKNIENDDEYSNLYQQTLLNIKNKTLANNKLKSLQKKLCDLEISKNRDKLIKTNGFSGKENLLLNIKDIMKEVYMENPKTFSPGLKMRKLYLSSKQDIDIEKRKKRPLTTNLPKVNYGEDYEYINDKIMNDIDNIISKVNDIDLHDFTTDQNLKDQRNVILVNKKPEVKIEKKNSIDSLLKEESGQSSEEEEISEEEDN